jgi:ferredoxin
MSAAHGAAYSAAYTLAVDWTACDGRGLCAELLPERIDADEWGYPLVAREPLPDELVGHARRAVALCPTLALRLSPTGSEAG